MYRAAVTTHNIAHAWLAGHIADTSAPLNGACRNPSGRRHARRPPAQENAMLPRLKIAALVFALAATAGLAAFAGTRDDAGMPTSQAGMAAPDFTGIDRWHNSAPLTLGQLHGKVVLVDFWTYSCINCIHTIPYVKEWDRKYRDQGRRGRRAYARVSVRARRGQRRRCDQALRHPVSGRAGQPLRHVARVRQPVLARAVPDRREREGRLHPLWRRRVRQDRGRDPRRALAQAGEGAKGATRTQ